jgi:hypothetical protein
MVAFRAEGRLRHDRRRGEHRVQSQSMTTSDPGSGTRTQTGPSKAERRAARAAVGAYHEAELARLLEHVREGLERYDASEIDAFELDELIHHYKRATQKLWSFCVGGGAHVYSTARTLEWLREQGELPDWWEQATPRRARG